MDIKKGKKNNLYYFYISVDWGNERNYLILYMWAISFLLFVFYKKTII